MRTIQDTVKYESEVKQTPTHVFYKINIYIIWGIDYNNHNK